MIDSALMFLLIVASLGVGGVLGLLSMVVMAIEIATRGLLTKRAWKGANPTRPIVSTTQTARKGDRPMQVTTKAGHGALVRVVWLVLGAFFALLTARVCCGRCTASRISPPITS